MLVFLITFLCLVSSIYGVLRHKFLLNPLTVPGVIWGIIIPISSLNLYGTYPVSKYAYTIIFIGLLAYFIGAALGSGKHQIVMKKEKKTKSNYNHRIDYKLLYVINFIAIFYFMIQFFQVLQLLLAGIDYSIIRELSVSDESNVLRSSRLLMIIRTFIATPAVYLGVALLPRELMVKKNKGLIFQILIISFLWVVTSGGRSILIWFAIYLVATFAFIKENQHFNWKKILKNNLWRIIFLLIFIVIIFNRITVSRRGEDVDLVYQMFIYFIAPVKFLDINLWKVRVLESSPYGMGLSSFYGLLYPIFFLIRMILGDYPGGVLEIYDLSFMDLEQTIHMGGETYMNAFATIFYQPYIDGRALGVLIILMLFGFFVGKIFFKARYETNQKYFLLYLLLLQQISFSFVRFYFTQTGQAITFILAIAIHRKILSTKAAFNR